MVGEDLSRVFQRLCAVNQRLSGFDPVQEEVAEIAEIISEVQQIRGKAFGRVLVDPARMAAELMERKETRR